MELQNFEKDLQRKFEDFQPTTDDSKIWMAIEDELPKEKKKKRIFIWVFGALSLITIGFFAFTYSSHPHDLDSAIAENTEDIRINLNQDNDLKTVNNVRENNSSKTIETSSILASQSETQLNNPSQVKESVNLKPSNQFDSKKIERNGSSYFTTNDIAKTQQIFRSTLPKTTLVTSSIPKTTVVSFNQLALIGFDLFKNERPFLEKPNVQSIGLDKVVTKSIENRSSLLFGIGIFKPSFKNTYSGSGNDLESLISNAEQSLEMIQFSLIYKYSFSSKIAIQSGIKFWSAQRQSLHQVCELEKIEGAFVNINRAVKTTHSRFGSDQNLTIPIAINLGLIARDNFKLDFAFGYEHSLWGSHSGYEIEETQTEYSIENDDQSRYQNLGGNYLSFAPAINYSLNNRLGLNVGAEYKFGLNHFSTDQSLIERSYDFYGINVGLNYLFK